MLTAGNSTIMLLIYFVWAMKCINIELQTGKDSYLILQSPQQQKKVKFRSVLQQNISTQFVSNCYSKTGGQGHGTSGPDIQCQ